MSDLIQVTAPSGAVWIADNPERWTPSVAPALSTSVSEWDADPDAANWPFVTMHDRVSRVLYNPIARGTGEAARAALADVIAACVPGAQLLWQPDGQATPMTCTVLSVSIDPGTMERDASRLMALGNIPMTVTFRTTPYWLDPEVQTTPTSLPTWATGMTCTANTTAVFDGKSHFWVCAVSHTAGTFDTDRAAGKWIPCPYAAISQTVPTIVYVPNQPGDVPALTRILYTHPQVTKSLALGLKSSPAVGFNPLGNYGGTSDGNAVGGDAADQVMTSAYATITPAPATLDVGANAGDYVVMARVRSAATTAADAAIRYVSSVVGVVGGTASKYGPDVNPISVGNAGYDLLNIGVASVPAGRTQANVSGTRWGTSSVALSVAAGSGNVSLGGVGALFAQAFTPSSALKLYSATVCAFVTPGTGAIASELAYLIRWSDKAIIATATPPSYPTSAADVALVFPTQPELVSGVQYALVWGCDCYGNATISATKGTVASGLYTGSGYAASGFGATYAITASTQVALGASLGIQAKCLEASKNLRVDAVVIIPSDESASVVSAASQPSAQFAAGTGIIVDYLSDVETDNDIYVGSATGSGVSCVVDAWGPTSPPLLRPGDNCLVLMPATPLGVAPQPSGCVITTRARRLAAFAGDLS